MDLVTKLLLAAVSSGKLTVFFTVMQAERFCSEKKIKTTLDNFRELNTSIRF